MACNRCGKPTPNHKCKHCILVEEYEDEFDGPEGEDDR